MQLSEWLNIRKPKRHRHAMTFSVFHTVYMLEKSRMKFAYLILCPLRLFSNLQSMFVDIQSDNIHV